MRKLQESFISISDLIFSLFEENVKNDFSSSWLYDVSKIWAKKSNIQLFTHWYRRFYYMIIFFRLKLLQIKNVRSATFNPSFNFSFLILHCPWNSSKTCESSLFRFNSSVFAQTVVILSDFGNYIRDCNCQSEAFGKVIRTRNFHSEASIFIVYFW